MMVEREGDAADRVVRAVTEDGSFRVIALRTTELVRDAIRTHGVRGRDARTFGELLTGAILVRETMAPGQRVQIVLSDEGQGSMVADSHPSGGLTRGLVSLSRAGGPFDLRTSALLKVIRSMPRGGLHQSIVSADPAGLSASLMNYMQSSEQVVATIGVATVVEVGGPEPGAGGGEGRVVAAGGYIVQLLPECARGPLAIMTERLTDFAFLDRFLVAHDARAEVLLYELLYGFPHEVLASSPVHHGCGCSEERALSAVATMGREELGQLVMRGEVVELTCEYCQRLWRLGPERFRALLAEH